MKLVKARSIRFIPSPDLLNSGDELIPPVPARSLIPDWYRESEVTFEMAPGEKPSSGLKTCVPFLDTFLSGYYILLQNDVLVDNSSGHTVITWRGSVPIIRERSMQQGRLIPRPAGHEPNHLAWNGVWGVRLPKGFSATFCHPLNRAELPFTTLAGVIDADNAHAWGNLPFFVRSGFSGVIPKGTPIVQVLPFRRDSWSSTVAPGVTDTAVRQARKYRSVTRGFSRDHHWVKKLFA